MKGRAKLISLGLTFGLIAVLTQRLEAGVAIAIKEDPGVITVTAPAIAGDLPADQQDSSARVEWDCSEAGTWKITAQMDAAYPTGINLYIEVSAPGGNSGNSTGEQLIPVDPNGVDVVTGITDGAEAKDQIITYTVKITEMAPPGTYRQMVTLTIRES